MQTDKELETVACSLVRKIMNAPVYARANIAYHILVNVRDSANEKSTRSPSTVQKEFET